MSQASSTLSPFSKRNASVVFAPGEKFFVRRVPLAAGGDVATQVTLALEGFSPFPTEQLFYGYRPDRAGENALVFAAYRKNFTPDEIAGWSKAAAVLPDFSVWLGAEKVPAAGISEREHEGRLELIGWDGKSELPASVLVSPAGVVERDKLVAQIRQRANLGATTTVRDFQSEVQTVREKRELIVRLAAGGSEARFDGPTLEQMDIRDKELLSERKQTARRDTLLWRAFAGVLLGLAACVVLEVGLFGMRSWVDRQQAAVSAQAPTVKEIDLAQSMAKRLEDISAQRLLPFEMLELVNNKRPRSVEFTRVSTTGLWRMDIEAQTASASDLRDFETEVRKLPGIASVEVRDPRTRDNVTTFQMGVVFKPGWFIPGGGS